MLHSENGVIGYGVAPPRRGGPHVVNAGGQSHAAARARRSCTTPTLRDHPAGLIDVAVLGAYEVAANGDFANWKMAGRHGGGIGGAMDLAVCAKHIFVMMEHTLRDNRAAPAARCTLPATAAGVVKLVMTDLGLFEPTATRSGCWRSRRGSPWSRCGRRPGRS